MIEKLLRMYLDTIRSENFLEYEKEFAQRICSAMEKGYSKGLHEPELVEAIVKNVHGYSIGNNKHFFKISTESVFIHGKRSQVEFDFYGEKKQRELGDLIFIISIVFDGKKCFEKLTINQFKKDKPNIRIASWDLRNKGQLYLLSRFPSFKGISGSIIPMQEYILPNYSGCLGSYGLIYRPGDFFFVSAIDLDSFVGVRNSLKMNELHPLPTIKRYFPFLPYFHPDIDELIYLMERFYRHYESWIDLYWNIFDNYHFSYNIFDFAHKYLTVGIGEPIFMVRGVDNPQARSFLHDLLSAARIKAEKKNLSDISDFVNGFFRYNYAPNEERREPRRGIEFDFMGGGIGIIHTTINLGE
jgi:hypothetical protein